MKYYYKRETLVTDETRKIIIDITAATKAAIRGNEKALVYAAYSITGSKYLWTLCALDQSTMTGYGLIKTPDNIEWGEFSIEELSGLGAVKSYNDHFPKSFEGLANTVLVRYLSKEEIDDIFNSKIKVKQKPYYEIYHIINSDEYRFYKLEQYETLLEFNMLPNIKNYERVYYSTYFSFGKMNEDMYRIVHDFKKNPPIDYLSRPLRTSDIVVLNADGDRQAYYYNDDEFIEIDDTFFSLEGE